MREGGGNCLKCLKRGWNRKEGRGSKNFEKGGGKAGSRGGCLKKGGLEPPYELCLILLSVKLSKNWQFVPPSISKYFPINHPIYAITPKSPLKMKTLHAKQILLLRSSVAKDVHV